ncbi:MAG: YitT family protein [Butyrivibrio sp.]|nr:YitT family protein [Butyrivibrio sp.]
MKIDLKRGSVRLAVVLVAAFLMAINIQTFVNAGGLYPGGAQGITIIIQRIALKYFSFAIPYTPINILLNIFPIYIGFRYIGKKFTLYSMIMVIANGIFVDLIPAHFITHDPLLIAVFGGILGGVSLSICLMVDATSGGTDFISIFLSQKKGIDAFPIILAGNCVILTIAGFLFGWDKALYSIIFQYVATQVLHIMYRTYQQETLFIITEYPEEVCELIYDITNHGATLIHGEGSFEHNNRKVIYSVVSASDVRKVIPAVKELDHKAFINTIRTERLQGNFYLKPRD